MKNEQIEELKKEILEDLFMINKKLEIIMDTEPEDASDDSVDPDFGILLGEKEYAEKILAKLSDK